MNRCFMSGTAAALLAVSLIARSQSEESAPITSTIKSPKLAAALKVKDEATVRRLAEEAIAKLGDRAGVPEVADEYRSAPAEVRPLSRSDAFVGFDKLLKLTRQTKWWKIGLDPSKTAHLPREASSCLIGCLAGCRANAPNRDELLKEAIEAGDYLLWTQHQAGAGVIPFPAYRGGDGAALQAGDRFLKKAEAAGRLNDVVRSGWVFDDLEDGGIQFDNGLCGVALFELYTVTKEERFLNGAIAAADWALRRDCVANWNYNSFSVYLLATAYRITRESRYLDAARSKSLLGVLPGQLHSGPNAGRWADPHNARPAYHYIMIRGLLSLFAVLPADDPAREPIARSIQSAMQSRNREFATLGVMNVDSALDALLLYRSLPSDQREAIGPCSADEAFAILERYCVSRLRNNQIPFSPGPAGLYFEQLNRRNADP